jgi:hypothetical protein
MWITKRAGNRDPQVDLAARVLEQRHGEANRQVNGRGVFDSLSKRELINENVVLRCQLLLIQQVVYVNRERAFGDGLPGVLR